MPGAASATSSSSQGNNGGGTKRKLDQMMNPQSPLGAAEAEEGSRALVVVNGESGAHDGRKEQIPPAAAVKMKAEVFEKDRETFLSTFEKPTQIYRFLRARTLESPIFLQRNLSYMKQRMSRSHKSRLGFKVDDLPSKLKKEYNASKGSRVPARLSSPRGYFSTSYSKPVKFYNVIVMGLSDGQIWLPDTRARVDICLARVCVNRRKEGPGPVSKIFEKSVEFKVYSPSSPKSTNEISIPHPAKCPVVSIPAEICSLGTNGHSVRSFKLVIRVTIPSRALQPNLNSRNENQLNHLNNKNNNNSDNCEEHKAKRRRSVPATKDRENFIYEGESKLVGAGGNLGQDKSDDYIIYTGHLSLYERDIPGDKINEVDFDVMLKKTQKGSGVKISHNRIRREISWEPFEEKHSKVVEQGKPAGRSAKMCLAIRTSSDSVPSFVDPPQPLLTVAIKSEVGASSERNSSTRQDKDRTVRVVYNFIHGNSNQQQTESRDDLRCPWCSLNCMQLYSLMKHLKLSHPRFHFSYLPIQNGAKIDVTINDSFDGSYSGSAFDLVSQPPGEAFARNGPTKRTEVFSILVCRPKPFKQTLQEFFECDEKDVDQRRTYITGHNRLYHHTSTCLPIHPREIDVDSEGEPDPEWLRVKTTMMIDEFTDVNEGEKELMKLWNLHVMKFNYVGDCQIPFACKRFVEFHGKELIQKNLYRNFCLHIVNLYDFGLLTPQGAHQTIQLLHSQMREYPATSAMMTRGESWKPAINNNNKVHAFSINGLGLASHSDSPTTSAASTSQILNSFSSSGARGGAAEGAATNHSSTLSAPTSNTALPKTAPSSAIKRDSQSLAGYTATISSGGSGNSTSSSSSSHVNGVRKLEASKVKTIHSSNTAKNPAALY